MLTSAVKEHDSIASSTLRRARDRGKARGLIKCKKIGGGRGSFTVWYVVGRHEEIVDSMVRANVDGPSAVPVVRAQPEDRDDEPGMIPPVPANDDDDAWEPFTL